MNRTGIEYLTHTWNPYTGCENWQKGICGGGQDFKCWAKTQTERFPKNFPHGFEPTFYPERIEEPLGLRKPARIGVSFMGDLFGDWVEEEWIHRIRGVAQVCSEHTFVFLTKCPWNLAKWNPWPDNCWVGASVTNEGLTYPDMMEESCRALASIKDTVKFLSFEPLLSSIYKLDLLKIWSINWVIIGAATNPYRPPKIEWVKEIIAAADRANIPVFLKDNLGFHLLIDKWRQELPNEL